MKKIRTIFGLQEKSADTLDGFGAMHKEDVRCWIDDEGNLYGAMFKTQPIVTVSTDIHEDGSVTLRGQNKDMVDMKLLIEQQVGKTLKPVYVTGVFPSVSVEGYGWEYKKNKPKSHWVHNKVLEHYGGRYSFPVMPLVIPKKYANKMEVKEMSEEIMTTTIEMPELKEWSVI